MAPVSKKNLDRKITARLPRRCRRQVERRIIADYSDFTGSSAFTATGQLATRAALVNANWRGWHGGQSACYDSTSSLQQPVMMFGALAHLPTYRCRDLA